MRREEKGSTPLVLLWKVREAHIIVDWEVRFQQLVDYKRVHGDCNVPQSYKANQQLGRWVSTQRTNKETMSEERRKRLNSIGFTWKVRELFLLIGKSAFSNLWSTNESTETATYHSSTKRIHI